jgi:hypothetical protein
MKIFGQHGFKYSNYHWRCEFKSRCCDDIILVHYTRDIGGFRHYRYNSTIFSEFIPFHLLFGEMEMADFKCDEDVALYHNILNTYNIFTLDFLQSAHSVSHDSATQIEKVNDIMESCYIPDNFQDTNNESKIELDNTEYDHDCILNNITESIIGINDDNRNEKDSIDSLLVRNLNDDYKMMDIASKVVYIGGIFDKEIKELCSQIKSRYQTYGSMY